jgi:hypothetical protein
MRYASIESVRISVFADIRFDHALFLIIITLSLKKDSGCVIPMDSCPIALENNP